MARHKHIPVSPQTYEVIKRFCDERGMPLTRFGDLIANLIQDRHTVEHAPIEGGMSIEPGKEAVKPRGEARSIFDFIP